MVQIDEINLINCPDCKYTCRDDYHYCRWCGHNFLYVGDEPQGLVSKFVKKTLNGRVSNKVRYCTHCKEEIRDFTMDFCIKCGERIPFQGHKQFCSCGNIGESEFCQVCNNKGTKKQLIAEQYYSIWHNQVIIPLSKEYHVDLSKNFNFKQYFKLTNEEENHIIYKMVYSILFNKMDKDIITSFKQVLDETKTNFKDIEGSIHNLVEQACINVFNTDGIVSSDIITIKEDHIETVQTPHIKNKHGAGTKVLATAFAGPLGLVATSGVKQENKIKQIHHDGKYCYEEMIFNKENIVYQTYTGKGYNKNLFEIDKSHMNKKIINWNTVNSIDENNYLILKTGETIIIPPWNHLEHIIKPCILNIIGTANENYNNENINRYYNNAENKAIDVIISWINEQIVTDIETSNNSNSDVESLQKIIDMYKNGLLTDDEFIAMKQKLIGNNVESISSFCENCGTRIIENSKFCPQCGAQIR